MRERFIDNFIVKLAAAFTVEEIKQIRMMLIQHCENYEITERCTDVALCDTLPECLQVYLVTRKIEGLSDKTLQLYAIRLKQMFDRIQKPIDEVETNDIRIFLYKLQKESNMSDRTLDGVRSVVCTFFKWAAAEGYIDRDPSVTIKKIKYEEKARGHLSETEIEMIRDACKTERDRALVEILYSTGCRVSEVIGMDISDIDAQQCEVNVIGKGKKHRTVYLNVKAKIAIQRYLMKRGDDSPALFVSERKPHNRLGKAGIEKIISELGMAAGIERRVFPHLIRHSTATHALERNMDVQEIQKMLGHSNLQTTMIYADVADNSVKASHHRCIV